MSDLFYFKAKNGFPEWETKLPVEWLLKNEGKKCWADLGRETGVRTLNQNSALHVWFDHIAKELNEGGQTIQQVLAKTVELEWSGDLVKEMLWRPIQKSLTNKKSTTELDKTNDINLIYEVLNRFLAERCNGVHIDFPSELNRK